MIMTGLGRQWSHDFKKKKWHLRWAIRTSKAAGGGRKAIQVEGTVPTGSHEGGKCRECQTRDVDSDLKGHHIHLHVGEHTPTCSLHASCF